MASSAKPKIMNWTPLHDLVLCKEIFFVNPYSAKKKSIQRSALWQKIAENLNSVKDPCFIVEKRSVRDRIAILIQRFKRQQAQELRESGTTPQHTDYGAMESSDTEQQEMNDENSGKVEADRKSSLDMRQKALETMDKTHKRNPEEGRALEYLKERAQQDQALKQEELELKKQENERLQNIQTLLIQMFKVMMDQQQQVQKQEKDDMSKMFKTLLD
ncbi:hypothetical protein P5673_011996 [Acropora cervicornis]|uniref:Uncharacterized protein n=1 Tax=Acropora cervicornis TaxID=6130 RepID=A0AAD9QP45_ACRCE|nr:hypothetical protein P5673_011996 [Acropora cervicornis]